MSVGVMGWGGLPDPLRPTVSLSPLSPATPFPLGCLSPNLGSSPSFGGEPSGLGLQTFTLPGLPSPLFSPWNRGPVFPPEAGFGQLAPRPPGFPGYSVPWFPSGSWGPSKGVSLLKSLPQGPQPSPGLALGPEAPFLGAQATLGLWGKIYSFFLFID